MSRKLPHIIVAINAFKEHLSSLEAGQALRDGLEQSSLHGEYIVLPVSDGGDGFLDVIKSLYPKHVKVLRSATGPDGDNIQVSYVTFFREGKKHAAIEFAEIAGMRRSVKRNAMATTSYGVGQVLMDAIQSGCTEIFLGLGGSATTDCGLGMLQALGVQFYDHAGDVVTSTQSATISLVKHMFTGNCIEYVQSHNVHITCFCDGNSNVGGSDGAWNRAKQKGATPEQIQLLHLGVLNMIEVFQTEFGQNLSKIPMTGCAGGAGAGLLLLGAKLVSGAEEILSFLKFATMLDQADLVFTGEGILDYSTCTGKLPAVIAAQTHASGVPCIGVAGEILCTYEILQAAGFSSVFRSELTTRPFEETRQRRLGIHDLRYAGRYIGNMVSLFLP